MKTIKKLNPSQSQVEPLIASMWRLKIASASESSKERLIAD
jgi:hypothetical protein